MKHVVHILQFSQYEFRQILPSVIFSACCIYSNNLCIIRTPKVDGTSFNKFVRPRWPYDMRPSVRAEKYIRDAGP